ncbi:MFS transporter [Bacillus subtilis]|nr:MFS transporter [Bacillus subtilis]MEC0364222.1 MFS transporter [Bacillus subtilis]
MNNSATSLEKQTIRKVTMRIIPFTFLLYIISYLDRANIGYAALQMNKDLALSSEVFGIVSGIFFIGYFIFEVPSNVMMQRFGARVWIARILITWGIVSVLTGLAQTAMHLYILRFLLGVAEAGFFPGIILYLTYWFRSKEQATTVALFTSAIPVSYIIGAPMSTWIMDHVNFMGIHGWRWMLILEGAPAVIMGIVTYFYLTERPEDAKWLTSEQKNWLISALQEERESKKNVKNLSTLKAMADPKVLFLSFIYFVYQTGSLGVGYWMPQIIKGFSGTLTNTQIGMIAMVPYIVATLGMIFWSRRSDRTGERRMHSAIPLLVSCLGLIGAGMTKNPYLSIALISISLTGMYSFKAPFWALPSLFLTQSSAAVAIAAINSVGNLGGFVGPYAVGALKDATGGTKAGLIFLSALLLISFVMVLYMRIEKKDTSLENQSMQQTI